MFFKYAVIFCVFLVGIDAFAKRNVNESTSPPTVDMDSLKKNMDLFTKCIDQSLANVMGDVNENHLQPLFSAIGDHLNRFSRAFDDIIAKPSTTPIPAF